MSLRRVNSILVICIILINGYTLLLPTVPVITFWWRKHVEHQPIVLHQLLHPATSTPYTIPDGEHLIVPALALDETIYEGKSIYTANKGVWRRPATSTPDHGGNTVLVGHRFTYTNPKGVFYNLDKLKLGDEVGVFWLRQRYLYRVSSITVVPPANSKVEAATTDERLTLYTCTPLWTAKNRLVVVAERSST